MQAVREKMSNMASVAKERLTICKARVDEKVEKASARTEEEKKIVKERRKEKEARAKMKLHHAKAKHAEQRLDPTKYTTTHQVPVPNHPHGYTAANPVPGPQLHPPVGAPANVPTYPPGEPVYGNVVPDTQVHPPVGFASTMAGANVPTYPLGGHPPTREYV